MYRLFYNFEATGDVLFILLNPEAHPTREVKSGRVCAIYKDQELIGINIFSFGDVCKIKAKGMIITPENSLIDVINLELKGANLEPLPYLSDSGYKVAQIENLEEHPLDEKAFIVTLSLGDKKYSTVSHYQNLKVGEKVVVEMPGCITYNGSVFHSFVSRNIPSDVSICSALELKETSQELGAFLVNELETGSDFFLRNK
jgi:tRNA-binding EMAP/Myf-like protein